MQPEQRLIDKKTNFLPEKKMLICNSLIQAILFCNESIFWRGNPGNTI